MHLFCHTKLCDIPIFMLFYTASIQWKILHLLIFLELISFLADPTYGSECCKSNYAIIDDYARATSMEAAITQYDRLLA